jgi:hypothetical protein
MDDSLLAAHGFVAGPGMGKPLDLGDMRMSLKASAQQTHGVFVAVCDRGHARFRTTASLSHGYRRGFLRPRWVSTR